MLDSPLRYIVVAAAGPSLMRVSVEARCRNGGNRGSLCTPVLITYREQWAREQDQHRRREENQNIVVYTFASICQRVLPPSALLFPGKRACTRPSLRNISPLLGKNATGRSPYRVYPYPAYSTASRISLSIYVSTYLSISFCVHLCELNRIYTISISLLALILISFFANAIVLL